MTNLFVARISGCGLDSGKERGQLYVFSPSFTDVPVVGNFVGNVVDRAFADKVCDKVSDKDGTR